jgi:hypothetical protein
VRSHSIAGFPQRASWEYFEHWLTALEHTLVEHALIAPEELAGLPR